MKSSNEMVESLLCRREQYESDKRQRRKALRRTLTPICCVCLVLLLGLGIWQGDIFKNEPKGDMQEAIRPGVKDKLEEPAGDSPDNLAANNRIVINHTMGGIPAAKINIALLKEDFVKMSRAEINEYYGVNIFPEVPEDLKEWDRESFGIFRREHGKGEVYWDQTVLNYSSKDCSRDVNIEIAKDGMPLLDYGFGESAEEKSVINNRELTIGLSESGYYYAVFMYHDVGFCVNAQGLSEDEFVSVLASIIK